jgi:uroporphyrinogen decarboxylase
LRFAAFTDTHNRIDRSRSDSARTVRDTPVAFDERVVYNRSMMTHRERILAAVSLREPDRLPMDLCGHINSSIHREAYGRLRQYLGLPDDPEPVIVNRMMQDVAVPDDLLESFDIDVRGIFHGAPSRVYSHERGVHRTDHLPENMYVDEWGVTWTMPSGGHYYDLHTPPLAGEISVHDIVRYPWPDPEDPGITDGLRERVDRLKATSDCALVLNLPSMFVHQSQYMRGFEDWFLDLAADPTVSEAIFDAVLEVKTGYAKRILETAGADADIVMTADDMGTQKALQFSPETFRRYFKPRMARYLEMIRGFTDAPILLHSCGSVYEIIDDLIEIGVNILNPVQTHAANMDPVRLKREFGDRLAFWGAMDIQKVLPFGTESEVEAEVRRLFEILGDGGGWVLGPSHNIQPEVPPENIAAMYRTGRVMCR